MIPYINARRLLMENRKNVNDTISEKKNEIVLHMIIFYVVPMLSFIAAIKYIFIPYIGFYLYESSGSMIPIVLMSFLLTSIFCFLLIHLWFTYIIKLCGIDYKSS